MIRMASIISRMKRHRDKAKELVKEDISNYLVFSTLAMECFQVVNSVIELGELVVSDKNLGFPSKYGEIFELLYGAKAISKRTLGALNSLFF